MQQRSRPVRPKWQPFGLLLLTLFLSSLAGVRPPHPAAAQQPPPPSGPRGLFSPAEGRTGALQALPPAQVQRGRLVTVETAVLQDLDSAPPSPAGIRTLPLNLFDDVQLTAAIARIEQVGPGRSFTGSIVDHPGSTVVLTWVDDAIHLDVWVDLLHYGARYAGNGVHLLALIDSRQFPPESPPLIPQLGAAGRRPETPPISGDDGSTLDVLVVYTAAARTAMGGAAAAQAAVAAGVTGTNTAYANSGINQRLRLVGSQEVTYTESGNTSTDLGRLQNTSDGFLDTVPALRDAAGADLVSLWVHSGNSISACGVGYLLNPLSPGFAPYAMNVVEQQCAVGNQTFAHELGHNMGASHDRITEGSGASTLYPYSFGYIAPTNAWRTVMAYPGPCSSCPRLPNFSNPDVLQGGVPMGVPEGQANAADNRKTLNNTAFTVANFRQAVSGPGFAVSCAPAATSIRPGGTSGVKTCTVTSQGGFAGTVNLSCQGLPANTSCVFSPTSVTLTANGQGTVALTISATAAAAITSTTFTVRGTSGATTADSPPLALVIVNAPAGPSNPALISIPASGSATPYPSTISVSGMSGTITKLTVTLYNFTHSWPSDVDVLLVGPAGQNLLILSDAGGTTSVSNLTLTIDDAAVAFASNSLLASGVFKPTNYDGNADTFPAPAPAPSASGSLSMFNGTNPNGDWKLFVVDGAPGDGGGIFDGWSLGITAGGASPDFALACSPSSIAVLRNASTPTTCTVTSQAGFNSAVALSCPTTSSGVSCAFAPSSVTPAANGSVNGTLTISATAGAPLGAGTVTVRGVSGALTHDFTENVTVSAALPLDVNGDGLVTPVDALCVAREVAGLPATGACPQPLINPDVNSDGQVTTVDALCIVRFVAGLPRTAACPIDPPFAPLAAASAGDPSPVVGSVALDVAATPSVVAPGSDMAVSVSVGALSRVSRPVGAWAIDLAYDADLFEVVGCSANGGGMCNTTAGRGLVRIAGFSAEGLLQSGGLATVTLRAKSVLGSTTIRAQGSLTTTEGATLAATPASVQATVSRLRGR